jgi:hypothetical protein
MAWLLVACVSVCVLLSLPVVAEEEEGVAEEETSWLSRLFSPRSYIPGELSGFLAVESRAFFHEEKFEGQRRNSGIFSLVTQPEWYLEWNGGDDAILFTPFFRYDSIDSERTHFDIRELYYLHAGNGWEIRAGFAQVFWGVAESQHLIDIINQTDAVEDVDGEDKLGQPMVQGTLIRDWGTLELFVMSGFRERTFPGRRGRLRSQYVVDDDDSEFESSLGRGQIDVVGRWSQTFGDWDVALYHFYGTGRDPRFKPEVRGEDIRLIPNYDVINQTAFQGQYTGPNLLLKLEALGREGQGAYRFAFVTGFEYTLVGVCDTAADLGLLGEFHFDTENDQDLGLPFNPFENDLFTGLRLTLNDEQSSELLAGVIVDVTDGGRFWSFEASRRLWSNWRIEVDMRLFNGIPSSDLSSSFEKDDFIQASLAWYF